MAFMKINVFIFVVNLYFTKAVDFSEISNNLYISGSSSPPFPIPSPLAVKCFNVIWNEINYCKIDAIKTWNITETSPVRDLCCAEWELIECDISAAKVNKDKLSLLFIIFATTLNKRCAKKSMNLQKVTLLS
jgi:hypothetical protein